MLARRPSRLVQRFRTAARRSQAGIKIGQAARRAAVRFVGARGGWARERWADLPNIQDASRRGCLCEGRQASRRLRVFARAGHSRRAMSIRRCASSGSFNSVERLCGARQRRAPRGPPRIYTLPPTCRAARSTLCRALRQSASAIVDTPSPIASARAAFRDGQRQRVTGFVDWPPN